MSGVVHVEEVASFPLKGIQVESMTALPGGGVATGHGRPDPNVIRVWSGGGDLVATLEGHTHVVSALACSASGDIVSGSGDGTVKVWRDNTCVRSVRHGGQVFSVAISPVDGTFFSGGYGSVAKVWSASTEECVATLEDHTGTIRAVCLLDNGDIVTGSLDRTVRVWAPGSWTCAAVHEEAGFILALVAVGTGGFAAGGAAIPAGGGFVSMWRGGEKAWRVVTAGTVEGLAVVQDVVSARTRSGVYFIQDGAVVGEWAVKNQALASMGGGRLAVVKRGAGDHKLCKVVQVVKPSRLATLHIMVAAWSAHGGTPPAVGDVETTVAVLARTLSLRRFCRPRGEGAPGASVEVVEPFARDIVGYL